MQRAWIVALLATVLTPPPATAAHDEEVKAAWRAIARADADAALALIADNHPGAAPELDDQAFQARLSLARRHVEERLPRVTSFPGYSALMSGLATDFRDGHVWSAPLAAWSVRTWAGIIPSRRNGRWFVAAHEPAAGETDLTGAELVSCDDQPFDTFARNRIALFSGNPAVEADLVRRAPGLLIDDANPFLDRARSCVLKTADSERQITLTWRRVSQQRIQGLAGASLKVTKAGMGVAAFPKGYWIELGTLDPSARAVVAEVASRRDALLAAPMVVLDLRGNGGGNSAYAREIAELLVGKARVAATEAPAAKCGGAYWRASRENRDATAHAASAARERGDAAMDKAYRQLAADIDRAIAEGRSFSPALPACAASARPTAGQPPATLPPAAMAGRLVLITDFQCFSSCLIATDLFRRVGALHVGQATDMSTRYMEVGEITLPSGLRTFSTLQKVVLGLPDFGPYSPDLPYPGTLDDTDALKAWVAELPRHTGA